MSSKVLFFRYCCEDLENALRWGFVRLDPVYEELALPPGPLPPGAEAGNVLTGETYDVSRMSMGFAMTFCPWCGIRLVEEDLDSSSGP